MLDIHAFKIIKPIIEDADFPVSTDGSGFQVHRSEETKELVINAIKDLAPICTLEIVTVTGVSQPGVYKIIQELTKDELIIGIKREGTKGRKKVTYYSLLEEA